MHTFMSLTRFSGHLLRCFRQLRLVVFRADIAKCRMAASTIVPDFDVVEDRLTGSRTALPDRISKFGLHRAEEALDDRVVPAIAFPTHTRDHLLIIQELNEIGTCVLAAAIGVKDCAGRRLPTINC